MRAVQDFEEYDLALQQDLFESESFATHQSDGEKDVSL